MRYPSSSILSKSVTSAGDVSKILLIIALSMTISKLSMKYADTDDSKKNSIRTNFVVYSDESKEISRVMTVANPAAKDSKNPAFSQESGYTDTTCRKNAKLYRRTNSSEERTASFV